MSKERQQRRAERDREAAIRAAARAAEAERAERRADRRRVLTSWLPQGRPRQSGIIAERRRRQTGFLIALLLTLNVLVWAFFGDWSLRGMVAVVSALAAPVLHTLMFRR